MAGDVYSAEISFGGELAPYAPYVVGRGVDGEHPWDAAWLAGQALYAEVLAEEFPGIPGGAL
jgi:hypothetical protein